MLRLVLCLVLALMLGFAAPGWSQGDRVSTEITVYMSPGWGCCGGWIEHLQAAGFDVTVHKVTDITAIKDRYRVPSQLRSCHTAIVDGYVIEGHVPHEEIQRLLRERPEIVGLSVPGMPAGSPGMEMPDGRVEPYPVVAFDRSGHGSVYARYPRN